MRIKVFDRLSWLVSDFKISQLIEAGGVCGTMLLLEPIINALTSRTRDLSQYAVVDGSAMVTILFACACMFFALKEFNKYPLCNKMLFNSSLVWFLLYCGYGVITMLWSVNLQLSGYRAFECTAFFLIILVTIGRLFSFGNLQLVIDWIILYAFTSAIVRSIKTMMTVPDFNAVLEMNQMSVPIFFYIAIFRHHHRIADYLIFVWAFLSGSTVLYIGMALGMISTIKGKGMWKIIALVVFLTLSIVALYMGPEKLLKDTVFYDKETISLEETSGRDQIMEAAIDCANEYPHGLGFFAAEPYWLYTRQIIAINGHNTFFSAMMGCGYVGLVLIVIFIVTAFFNVHSHFIHTDFRAALLGSYYLVFVECLGNPSIGSRIYGAWISEVFIFCLIAGFYCYGKYGFENQNYLIDNNLHYENNIRR